MCASEARLTPWTLVFGDARFDAELFPALDAEAAARGSATSFDAFLTLPAAAPLLNALSAEPGSPVPETLPDAATMRSFGPLVWHAWHFWRQGRRTWAFDADQTRALLQPRGGAVPTAPAPPPAGYAQIERNRVWTRIDAASHAEPLDGFFWVREASDPGAPEPLSLLFVLGLRPERPGVSVIGLRAPAGFDDAQDDAPAREDGPDFGNILPGGELDGLHGMVTAAEAVKLASRALRDIGERMHREAS